MTTVKIGDRVWWQSPHGYSRAGGEPATVYAVRGERAAINVAGDAECPEGYSYSVHVSELSEPK